MAEMRPIEPLDVEDINGISDWHERFEHLCKTSEKINASNKTSFYITYVGKQAYRLLKDLAFPDKVETFKVDKLQKLLEAHIQPVNFEAVEREKFHNLRQRPGESLRSFLLSIQQQAAKCSFGSTLEDQMRDRIVAGVSDLEIKKKLLRESCLTFKSAKKILIDWNDVNVALHPAHDVLLHYKGKSSNVRKFSKEKASTIQTKPPAHSTGQCDSCGGAHSRQSCKFRQAECHSCHRKGHIKRVCRARATAVRMVRTEESSEEMPYNSITDDLENLALTLQDSSHIHQKVLFDTGKSKQFILDTGSPVTFMNISDFKALGFSEYSLRHSSRSIKGVTGHSLNVLGQFNTNVRSIHGSKAAINLLITSDGPAVLGLDGLRALKVHVVLHVDQPISNAIKNHIAICANNQGGMKVEPIHLEVSGDPIFMKARPMAFGLRPAIKEKLDNMVSEGILRPVKSSQWATPIVTVIKEDGSPRICGDYRITLNPRLQQTATTTLDVESMFEGLSGMTYFSKVDLSQAFHQIPLDKTSSEMTTINTMWGLFQYRFLPFGLNVSPGIFQAVINDIISGLLGVRAYIDDIIVAGSSRTEHDFNLQQLLQRLQAKNIKINAKKSVFAVKQLKYLGYLLDGTGISADKNRFETLRKAPRPETPDQLRSFLGFAQYYAKFVPNFMDLAGPLFEAIVDNHKLNWTNDLRRTYDHLLQALLDGKVLRSFQINAPTELIVDASEYAIGAVLEQRGHPVICISRKLTKSEKNYAQIQKEALAIHWAILRLHKYLFAIKFTIVSDHKPLEFIFHPHASLSKTSSNMLQRWALHLSAYSYDIMHRPGKQIAQADYLSRNSSLQENWQDAGENTFLTNPLPVTRNEVIQETRLAYGPVSAGLRRGWSSSARKRFPELYARRAELQLLGDGTITFNDRTLIPPPLRQAILEHLHSGHLGRDKMVSLARLLAWWPSINTDIKRYLQQCEKCRIVKPLSQTNWTPWPIPFKAMQRLHADYCGPLLGGYYALVVEDAFSKFPEVFLTRSPTAEFTKKALQGFFAREGIPQVLVTDNGSHFTAELLQAWLRSVGCCGVFTPPRHPASNGQAENFVRTLKTVIRVSSPNDVEQLQSVINNFLLQYRSAAHAATGKPPALLFKGRNLRTTVGLDSTEVIFFRGNDSRPCNGLILGRIGNRMFNLLDRADGTVHRRHRDQLTFTSPRPAAKISHDPEQPNAEMKDEILQEDNVEEQSAAGEDNLIRTGGSCSR